MKSVFSRLIKPHIKILGLDVDASLVVPIFNARPVFVMIVSQAFNSVILPATVACILYLGNRKDIMGENKNTKIENVIF